MTTALQLLVGLLCLPGLGLLIYLFAEYVVMKDDES